MKKCSDIPPGKTVPFQGSGTTHTYIHVGHVREYPPWVCLNINQGRVGGKWHMTGDVI